MAWIKRNLIFVITIVVGLGLAGAAGYFVYQAAGANSEAKDQYATALNDLTTLQQKKPFPSQANIKQANEDSAKVAALAKSLGTSFVNFSTPANLDARQFIDYLNTNLTAFRLMSTNANIQLPSPEYPFSFTAEANRLSFPTANFTPWMEQVEQIRAILEVLCEAKINSLDILQRAAVGGEDPNGQDYVASMVTSNQTQVISPYKIAFHAFSEDIARVLAGFAKSPHCMLVKNIVVTSSAAVPGGFQGSYQPPPGAEGGGYQGGGDQGLRARLGGGRFRRPPPQIVQQAETPAVPAAPMGPMTILKPMPLFVTITLDVVQVKNSR